MAVSSPWKGYGSAIFLELGQTVPDTIRDGWTHKGEACISMEWDWRAEKGTGVLYGSSNRGPQIDKGISGLQGIKVEGISIAGSVPELAVHFSNGQCLKSMVMVTGDPQWCIRLPDQGHIIAEGGLLFVRYHDGESSATLPTDSSGVIAWTKRTALRWGTPVAEPKGGSCRDCQWYVRLDGDGYLLDFGVCTAVTSPFDGRAVNCGSGCPAFAGKE